MPRRNTEEEKDELEPRSSSSTTQGEQERNTPNINDTTNASGGTHNQNTNQTPIAQTAQTAQTSNVTENYGGSLKRESHHNDKAPKIRLTAGAGGKVSVAEIYAWKEEIIHKIRTERFLNPAEMMGYIKLTISDELLKQPTVKDINTMLNVSSMKYDKQSILKD